MIDLALAAAKAKDATPTKYLVFREDCFEAFFERFDFVSDPTCVKFTFSKVLGYAIVLGATIYKVPQIQKLMSSKSAQGLSRVAYYFETIGFIQTLGLSLHMSMDFSVYGDTILIIAQNSIVIILIWQYSKDVSIVEKLAVSALLSGYLIVLVQDTMVTDEIWVVIQSLAIAMVILSRAPQIATIFSEGSTGALSLVTVALGWFGSLSRLATVLIESDDFKYRLQFICSAVLNSIIVLQFVCYWNTSASAGKQVSDTAVKTRVFFDI